MKKILTRRNAAGLLLSAILVFSSGCSGGGGGGAGGDTLITSGTPTPTSITPTAPAEQAAFFIAQLASPDTRLSGWLGLYDALGVPVLQQGTPVGTTGDDPIGIHDWQVWYASGLDQPGQGIPLSDAGRMMALTLSDADSTAYGPILLSDLRLAAQSSDPQIKLLGLFVRERVLQGPSHVDILDSTVTPETAVIDLPTLQLLGWVAVRGALLQDAVSSQPTVSAPSVSRGGRLSPKKSARFQISNLKCSDVGNDFTKWANWLANKIGGGLELPGMAGALPSATESVLTQFKLSESTIDKANKAMGKLNLLTTAIGAGLQYLAMDYSALQDPDPLIRTKGSTYDGNSAVIALLVEYDLGKIPDGESLKACYLSHVANAMGISLSFPPQGPIGNTEIFIEPGKGIPNLVLFDLNNSTQTTVNRVSTGTDGQANINVLGRHQRQDIPDSATPVMKEFSIVVSAQPEEAGTSSMANIFFDGLTVSSGGISAVLTSLMDILKTFHWKETELVFRVQDWSVNGWNGRIMSSITGSYSDTQSGPTAIGTYSKTKKATYNEQWTFEIDPAGHFTELSWEDLTSIVIPPGTLPPGTVLPTESPRVLTLPATATLVATASYEYKSIGSDGCDGEGGIEYNGTYEWNDSDSYAVTTNATFPASVIVSVYRDGHYELTAVTQSAGTPVMTGTESATSTSISHPGSVFSCGGGSSSQTIQKEIATSTGRAEKIPGSWDEDNAPGNTGPLNPNMLTLFFGSSPAVNLTRTLQGASGYPSIVVPVASTVIWDFQKL